MIRALQSAASGMLAQQQAVEITANNLSNVNTTGYKTERAEFQDLLYAKVQIAVPGNSPGLAVGQGVRLNYITRNHETGQFLSTDSPYDLAIYGMGFFRVQRADGTVGYTRDGSFQVDRQGTLVTAGGDPVLGRSGPIRLPAGFTEFTVLGDGTVTYTDAEGKQADAGQITLAMFVNPGGLTPVGQNQYAALAGASRPQLVNPGENGSGTIGQRYLESSNVQTAEEMVKLMAAQRAYELNARVIYSADEMLSMANNLRRG